MKAYPMVTFQDIETGTRIDRITASLAVEVLYGPDVAICEVGDKVSDDSGNDVWTIPVYRASTWERIGTIAPMYTHPS